MIYLIGGAPRTGKSLMAQKIITTNPMPYLSCDFLYELRQVKDIDGFSGADIIAKGRLFYLTLKELLVDVSRRTQDCVIEGEVILPEFIPELAKKYDIRCCFIGISSTSLDNILKYAGYFNWPQWKLDNDLAREVKDLAALTVSRSSIIQAQANEYNQPYFDLAGDYTAQMELAIHSLLADL